VASRGPEPSEPDLRTLADRVNWLVATVHPAGRGPYSNYEVAALIEEVTGEKVSHNAIWKLRNGQAANPTMRLVSALAQVFGVPPGFFYAEQSLPADQVEMLALIRGSGITSAQLRAFAELTPQARQAIVGLIKETARAEAERQQRSRTAS
jgi:transcriptional regulator with XRE-family HTH domain